MTLLSFAVLVVVAKQTGDEIEDFNGLAKRSPFLAFAMLIAMVSLAGVPFTAGFLGKFFIFDAAIAPAADRAGRRRRHHGRLRILLLSQSGARDVLGSAGERHRRFRSAAFPAHDDALIAGIVVLGVYPQPILNALDRPGSRFDRAQR